MNVSGQAMTLFVDLFCIEFTKQILLQNGIKVLKYEKSTYFSTSKKNEAIDREILVRLNIIEILKLIKITWISVKMKKLIVAINSMNR